MLFKSARSSLCAALSDLERKDACGSWDSDEEVEASIFRVLEAEEAVARAPASTVPEVAYKVALALDMLDEAGATGKLEDRLRTMLRGALDDLNRSASAAA